jgi:hypothetical protein
MLDVKFVEPGTPVLPYDDRPVISVGDEAGVPLISRERGNGNRAVGPARPICKNGREAEECSDQQKTKKGSQCSHAVIDGLRRYDII